MGYQRRNKTGLPAPHKGMANCLGHSEMPKDQKPITGVNKAVSPLALNAKKYEVPKTK